MSIVDVVGKITYKDDSGSGGGGSKSTGSSGYVSTAPKGSTRRAGQEKFDEWKAALKPFVSTSMAKLSPEDKATVMGVWKDAKKLFPSLGFWYGADGHAVQAGDLYAKLHKFSQDEVKRDEKAAAYNAKHGFSDDMLAPSPAPEAPIAGAIDPVTGEYKVAAINIPDPKETGAVKPRLTDAQKKAKTLEERYNAWGSGTKKDFDALLEQLATSDKPDEGTLTKWMDAQNKAAAKAGNAGLRAISFKDVMDMANARHNKKDPEETVPVVDAMSPEGLAAAQTTRTSADYQGPGSADNNRLSEYGTLQQELATAEKAVAELEGNPLKEDTTVWQPKMQKAKADVNSINKRMKALEDNTNKPTPKPKKEYQHTGSTK